MTSVVQVFFQDKMAAVAHVIGTEQLPVKSQVIYVYLQSFNVPINTFAYIYLKLCHNMDIVIDIKSFMTNNVFVKLHKLVDKA